MPIYEYHCGNCNKDFQKLAWSYQSAAKCPDCNKPAEITISVPAKRNPDAGIQR